MGLIARIIEQMGISTVCFNLLLATPAVYVRPPRTIWLPHLPFSLPLGLPGNTAMQRQLLLDAFELLCTAQVPGVLHRRAYTAWQQFGHRRDLQHPSHPEY